MRYTTVIDITELPRIYRNVNARLIYLHLVLRSGYHDADRDLCEISIRRLAQEVGLTLSATRHALAQLQHEQLLCKKGESWLVKKWIVQEPPTPRKQAKKDNEREATEGNIGARYKQTFEEYKQRVYAAVRSSSKEELQAWLQELTEGRRCAHHGASIAPNQDNIAWMRDVIAKI